MSSYQDVLHSGLLYKLSGVDSFIIVLSQLVKYLEVNCQLRGGTSCRLLGV
jgi:hypothetical protein